MAEWYTCLPAGKHTRLKIFMEYFVYALSSLKRKYIYFGLTKNVEKMTTQHNSGKEKTTKSYSPFQLIYTEKCSDRKSARAREKYLKSGCGKEFLKNL
jgi:putative endonuclease